jgi:hypothetical protein
MDHERNQSSAKGGGGCKCKDKNRLTCITLNSASAQATLVGSVNTPNSYYEFNFPASFSVHRHKACTIQVNSASVAYDTTGFSGEGDVYHDIAATIDAVTNINVQGLALNLANYPESQYVQTEIDVADVKQTGSGPQRVFHSLQPSSNRFRCQSLPDKIHLTMSRVAFKDGATPTIIAPDFISMTLEIEFDE